MLHARRDSTNASYQGYWERFCRYCTERNLDPFEATIMEIVGFVDCCRRAKSWVYSTTKGCVAAITAFRDRIDGYTVFTHPAMHEYLQGAKRLTEGRTTLAETWDPAVVLLALERAPFEPLHLADMKWLSWKLAVLLLLTTAARGSEIAHLTVKNLEFSVNDVQATIYPDPTFVPKTVSELQSRAPLVLHAFFPVPGTAEEQRYNLSCPVRALRIYLTRTAAIRKSDRLLVSYRERSPGLAISSQRLAHWLVEAVTKAYTMSNMPAPKLTAHSTRGVATSVALLAGINWDVIRQTASWKSDGAFRKHYYRHVTVRSVADAVLRQVIP